MEKVIRSAISAAAGIFIVISMFSALMAVPEFREIMSGILRDMVFGLIVGAVVAGIIGIVLLYISIKGR